MTIGEMGATNNMEVLVLVLTAVVAVAEAARRIAQKIPGKTGDEITSKIERYSRVALDFAAGFHGAPDDPTAIRTPGTKGKTAKKIGR